MVVADSELSDCARKILDNGIESILLMYEINEWVLFALALLLFSLSAEIGFQFGRKAVKGLSKEAYPHVATIEGALLGLLALLLGFAFSMAMGRYDSRREIVVAEANDLQTTYLRSKLIRAPYRAQAGRLLLEYVDSRIDYLEAGRGSPRIKESLATTVALQDKLWSVALSAAQANSDEVTTGYFISALNDLIDDHSRRVNASESHVPDIIIGLLIFVGVMTIGITGYSSGFNETRLALPRAILILLVAATLTVIIDLDRPRRGLITINETSMRELKEILSSEMAISPR